ncbi:TonB-dependent receptor [Pedobacter sp. PLR]|uniref:SusC/RagA family TonB-linked outer membrane protein n=1 Tax=Pedobacter sp. PLR TaxID=2994465 RepID=UPI002246E211|nr:TonB-dependent receptor [Pedobacter sp. PLR]MCX2450301.1 TonB-dependent receptor [Pedobacter sp. PLR]
MNQIYTMNLYLSDKWKVCPIRKVGVIVLLAIGMLFSPSAFAQTIKVKGVVKDDKGVPLPGVGVKIKGTAVGTSTNGDGVYTVSLTGPNQVLVFTYIGFIPQEIPVGTKTTINVSLKENLNDLDEIVVTGYGGKTKKRDLTAAISSVNAKDIEERQPINLFDALQGQAAGVLVMNDGGEPGAEGSIKIRGASTFSTDGNGSNPLYVIDGVISDNGSTINPSDIQNIEVLKDAASAAIYGARAANGVILITTKRGQDGNSRIDAQYSHVFGKLAHKIAQANASELRYYRKLQAGNPNGNAGGLVDSLNPSFNSDNDLQDMLLGNTGHRNEVKLSVSGGQKGITYYGSGNYLDDQGIALNTWIKRLQSRFNVEFQVSPKVKWATNASYYFQTGNFTSINNSLKPVFDRPSYARIYYPDGTLTSYLNSKRNPVANALLEDNTQDTYKAQISNSLRYDIIKDLNFTATFNAQLDDGKSVYFMPRFLSANGIENLARNGTTRRVYYETQGFFNYNKVIGNDHTITGLAGFSMDRTRSDFTNLEGKNLIAEDVHFVTGANMVDLTKQRVGATAYSLASFFFRPGYNYKGRYIVQGTFRNDASSRFGRDRRSGSFISGSAAWRFSDEKFMGWAKKYLDDAKLRVSYGTVGNDASGNYESIQRIEVGSNSYGGVAGASLMETFGNPTIKWENTVTQNLGMDLVFMKGRLNLSADYYIKTTNDLLYDRQIPKETGFNTVKVNVGNIENKGLELALNGTPIKTDKFTWSVTGNLTFEKGKILKLYNGQEFIAGNKHLIQEGGNIGDFYGWKNKGVFPYDVSNAFNTDGIKLEPVNVRVVEAVDALGKTYMTSVCDGYTLNGQPYTGTVKSLSANGAKLKGGDTEWVDINNDGVIDDADRHVIGNAQPDFYFGLINNLSYKQFSLSFIFNGTIGGQVYNSLKQGLTNNSSSNGPALPEAIYGAWTKQGDIATYPYFPDKDTRGSQKANGNSMFLENASFIRLSSARFTYRFTPAMSKRVFTKNISAYIYGTNLATWTNYTGYDPEFSSSTLTPGDDTGKYPKRRELGLGINIGF